MDDDRAEPREFALEMGQSLRQLGVLLLKLGRAFFTAGEFGAEGGRGKRMKSH
jgi:hypothetical protein